MSIRKGLQLQRPELPEAVGFELAPKAFAAWDRNVTAAEGSNDDTILILEPIGEDWFGEGVTAKSVKSDLDAMNERPARVLINSPGGDFFEGLAIYNLLNAYPAEVTVEILGIAASAASIVAMAGDDIRIAKAGMMMIHNTQWVAIGDRHVMLETHNTMKVFDETLARLYADRTGIDAAAIAAMMDETTFMAGPDAIEQGFADELLPADSVTRGTANTLGDRPLAYRIDAAMARHGVPRAERRRLLRELTGGKPGAATGDATPSAGDCGEGLASLRAASMRLRCLATT